MGGRAVIDGFSWCRRWDNRWAAFETAQHNDSKTISLITIIFVLALAFAFGVALYLFVEAPRLELISERLDPAASTTRGVLFDRNGVPRRYY